MIRFALYDYIPQRFLNRATFEEIDLHRRILDFKDAKPYATRWAAKEIGYALSDMDLSDTYIVTCQTPTSSASRPAANAPTTAATKSLQRWFANGVAQRTDSTSSMFSDTAKRHTSTTFMNSLTMPMNLSTLTANSKGRTSSSLTTL